MEAKAVWKVGEVWVGQGERTGRGKGVGGRGGQQMLWDIRERWFLGNWVIAEPALASHWGVPRAKGHLLL